MRGMTTGRMLTGRRVLVGGTLLVGAGVLAGAASPGSGALTGPEAEGLKAPAAPDGIWAASYWAVKHRDGKAIKLAMYRKRQGAPGPDDDKKTVLLLVHGSSPAALASYDLSVPGHPDYSLMNVFARLGYDVWALDHEGYGASTHTDGNSDIASGVQDLIVATDLIRAQTGQSVAHLLGESSGAIRAAAFAMEKPERVGRLVLSAFTYTGAGSPTLAKRAEGTAFYRTHNRRPRDKAMLESIFTRDKKGTSDPDVVRAFVAKEGVYEDSVPTGTYLDMTTKLPLVDPARVLCPVLLAKGEYDGISTLEDLEAFFDKLPNGDRQLSMIKGAAHSLVLSRSHLVFQHVAQAFLTMPEAPALG